MKIELLVFSGLLAISAAQTDDTNRTTVQHIIDVANKITEPMPPILYPDWTYFDEKRNLHCILVEMRMQMNFNYRTKDNKISAETYSLPDATVVHAIDGMCAPFLQNITLGWGVTNESTVMLQFTKPENSTEYWLSEFKIDFNVSGNVPDAAANQTLSFDLISNSTFKVPYNFYYYCRTSQRLQSNDTGPMHNRLAIRSIDLPLVRLQAFYDDSKSAMLIPPHFTDFFQLCPPDKHDFMVFMIILGALLVSVVIGIIVYYSVQYWRSWGYTSF